MKKYIIFSIVGLLLVLSAPVYADDISSLVGRKVQGEAPVYLDGQQLGDAIVIDGRTYISVRKVAEAWDENIEVEDGNVYLGRRKVLGPPPLMTNP